MWMWLDYSNMNTLCKHTQFIPAMIHIMPKTTLEPHEIPTKQCLWWMFTIPCLSTIFIKGNTFLWLLADFPWWQSPSKMGLIIKGKNLLLEEQILSSRSESHWKGRQNWKLWKWTHSHEFLLLWSSSSPSKLCLGERCPYPSPAPNWKTKNTVRTQSVRTDVLARSSLIRVYT